jgi:hypothetical protein
MPLPRDFSRKSAILISLSAILRIAMASDSVEHVRLVGGQFFGGGYVEIWQPGGQGWRAVCDRDRQTWTQVEGELSLFHETVPLMYARKSKNIRCRNLIRYLKSAKRGGIVMDFFFTRRSIKHLKNKDNLAILSHSLSPKIVKYYKLLSEIILSIDKSMFDAVRLSLSRDSLTR